MNELLNKRLHDYFGNQADKLIEELNKPVTQGFFLNTNKMNKDDILNIIDFDYEKSDLSDDSYYHNHDNIGKTKAYELGLIYPQEISASLTSKFINTDNPKLIVDMCAAPGGKTINILNRLDKNVICISNDENHTRSLALSSNIERLGLDNTIITNKKCKDLADLLQGNVDIVVLDAPCSGEGMLRKYPEINDDYSIDKINELADIQKQLLEYAYKMLKDNGILIYSTCTYAFEEDEDQIKEFMNNHSDIELINVDLDSYSQLNGTVKLCPLNNTEGQFFTILKKHNKEESNNLKYLKSIKENLVDKFIKDNLNIDNYYLYKYKDTYYMSFIPLIDLGSNVLRYGINVGNIINNRFEPNHNLYRANSLIGKYKYVYDLNDEEYDKYIQGYELKINEDDHYYLVTYKNNSLGYGKCSKGMLKNKYPKGLRRMI